MSVDTTASSTLSRRLDTPVVFQRDLSDGNEKEHGARRLKIFLAIAVSIVGVVTILLTTYMFPAAVGSGFHLTQRAPLANGKTATGVTVLVGKNAAATQAVGRIKEMFRNDHEIVKILGVPGDKVTSSNGILQVNGVDTGVAGDVAKPAKLSISYLTVCVKGCLTGTPQIVETKNVIGEVVGD